MTPLYRCSKCGAEKPDEAFHRRATHSTGRAAYCKPCATQAHREWRETPTGRAKHTAAVNGHKARHPERRQARVLVATEIRAGRMVRGECEYDLLDCDGPIEAHHDDYGKPLDVRWLCRRHHRLIDKPKVGRPRLAATHDQEDAGR